MSDTILSDLRESIKKNLPAQVGDQLRKRLEEADKLDSELAQALQEIKLLMNGKCVLEDKVRLLEAQQTALTEIERREKEVAKKEQEQKMRDLEVVNSCLSANNSQLFDLMKIVFKSPVYKKELSAYEGKDNVYENGNYVNRPNGNKSSTETITEE